MKLDTSHFFQSREEVTEDKYDEMLCVLPPEIMVGNAFLVGEPVDHDHYGNPRYQLYFRNEGKHYAGGLLTKDDFEALLVL